MNKTSKKVSTLAATVAVATAFCGLCAGIATTVKAESNAPAPVQTSAANDYKVILNPGWNFESGTKKLNTITDAGVTEITATQAESLKYYVENGYICNIPVGDPLPTPTAGRTGLTFAGWRYTKNGEVLKVSNVPAATTGNIYLYADWTAKTTSSGGGGGGGQVVTASVTVNGNTMTKNDKPMEGVDEEYMLTKVKLEAGALTFNINGSKATISELESSSSGLTFASGTVSVPKAGTYDLYLKKMSGKWVVYGARDVSQDQTSIKGEVAVAGTIYLAGAITDADFNWNNWNPSNGYKGLKVTGGTLTVRLTKNDDCKFVKYSTNSNNMVWQGSLTGAGTHISFSSGGNMKVNDTGTYTFTVTESSGSLSVKVTDFQAG